MTPLPCSMCVRRGDMIVSYALACCCVIWSHFLALRHSARPSPFPRPHVLVSRLLGGKSKEPPRTHRVDYLGEAIALERQGDFDAALTSYRLALRDRPNDPKILQNMAIAFSKTGRLDDAIRCYRRSLEIAPQLSGSHYGLAFLLLKRNDRAGAEKHLEAFLAKPPSSPEAERWVRHAQMTLEELRSGVNTISEESEP